MQRQDGLTSEELCKRGENNLDAHNYDAALEDFTKSIELNPQEAKAYFNRGCIYYQNKRHSSAGIFNLMKAKELDLNNKLNVDLKLSSWIALLDNNSFFESLKSLPDNDAMYLLRKIQDKNASLGKKFREGFVAKIYNPLLVSANELYATWAQPRIEIRRVARLLYQGSHNRLTEKEENDHYQVPNKFRFFYRLPKDVCVLIAEKCGRGNKVKEGKVNIPEKEALKIAANYFCRPAVKVKPALPSPLTPSPLTPLPAQKTRR